MIIQQQIIQLLSSKLSYAEIDQAIDQLLGLKYDMTENLLRSPAMDCPENFYVQDKLCSEGLYTSYLDFFQIANNLELRPGDIFIDLGAGWGRSKLLFNILFPTLNAIAVEGLAPRLQAGLQAAKNLKLPTEGFIQADLFHWPLPAADYYFCYLPAGRLLSHLLLQLRDIALTKDFTLITLEGHGDFFLTLDQDAPWLKLDKTLPTHSHRHHPDIRFYRPLPRPQLITYFEELNMARHKALSTLDKLGELNWDLIPTSYKSELLLEFTLRNDLELLIEAQDIGEHRSYLWSASSFELQRSLQAKHYRSTYPMREFHQDQIKKIIQNRPAWWELWRTRRLQNWKHPVYGEIRKIIIEPQPSLEFANGERVAASFLHLTAL